LERGNDLNEAVVKGYIVGYVLSGSNVSRDNFSADTNFAIADSPDETNTDNMIYVQVPNNHLRGEFGLQTNPDLLGTEVIVSGSLDAYFGTNGIKSVTDISLADEDNGEQEPEEPVELELLTIQEARDQATGEVKTKGVVTAKLKNTIHIQDGTAALAVRPTSLDVNLGDQVTVTGTLGDYRNLLQLNSAEIVEKTDAVGVPDPLELTGADLANHESELAVLSDVEITSVSSGTGWANYTAVDSSGVTFTVRDENDALGINEGTTYESITGIVQQFDDTYQILPRDIFDIVEDSSMVMPVYATPGAGTIPSGTEVTLQSRTTDAAIYYTTDGSEPDENSTLYTEPIVIDEAMTLRAVAMIDDRVSEAAEFNYDVYDAEEGIKIHHIQGEGHTSPMEGQTVYGVEGIVTYVYDIRGANYFHMQTPDDQVDDNPYTSEGLVVYTGRSAGVSVGDLVEVTGEVSEYHIDGYDDRDQTDLSVTQINARDDRGGLVDIIDNGVELPAPVEIVSSNLPDEIKGGTSLEDFDPEAYSLDYWESIEGMRVEVQPSRAVAPQQHGDLFVVTDEYNPSNTTVNGGIRLTEDGPDSRLIPFKLHPNNAARDFAVSEEGIGGCDILVNSQGINRKMFSWEIDTEFWKSMLNTNVTSL
ncbi:MAG: DUF6359 domain-containing protein, partial [Alkalibacterium sp.]